MLNIISKTISIIDSINNSIGIWLSWLTLGCVLNCFLVVVLRYVFSIGFPWMQELYVWQHTIIFLGGASFTLLHNKHVNVDILYSQLSNRKKCFIDILGTLFFLFPWIFVVAFTSSSFITSSWNILEPSSQTNGMVGLFLLKSMIWFFCFFVFLQGISLIGSRMLILSNHTTKRSINNKYSHNKSELR